MAGSKGKGKGKGKGDKRNDGTIRVKQQQDGPHNQRAGDDSEAETPEYEIEKIIGARMGHLKEVWLAAVFPLPAHFTNSRCVPGSNGLPCQVGGVR
jgi:hypothetical protein